MAPELREQLQAHLGSAYTIERELGGGGMSRVFLAQDARLERTVVVKVLPPQLAAGVSVDRFERETHLAAKLQHPHIVPLFTAGSAGDLLYYIMPHIEGASLRARLAHDHELPVGETVRILRDVVEALAYAHAHGIVHRDIKPANVLLSGKHALVTDFGVAKAVAESTGQTTLTSLGVALGTPAYMAPEQAAADPNTDHRADVYAVGVLAYEMLTGRQPFTGASRQAVLVAQVSQQPEPLTSHRANVPPALAALVMRCLEKKPADRYQTAEELLSQLESIVMPSGTEAAIQRAHPIRVVTLFATASTVVLIVVYGLVRGLGLPDWVFLAAVGLLLVGLPIMVVTGLVERRRAMARSTGLVAAPAPGGLLQWLTWRKALVGGAAAFGALGLGTTAYMAMRLLGIGPLGSLVASGVLRERERLLLADFQNRSTDSTLGPTLAEAFRIDLSQSPTVKLVEAQAVTDELQRMRRTPGTPLDLAVARELAVRLGVKAVLSGQIDPVGRGYVLSASLVSAGDGEVLTGARETAANETALIPAIDHLSKRLRERIGESLQTIRANPPLERVTTGSLEALRKYSEGVRAFDEQADYDRAVSLLEEATARDTGFGMAYRKLAPALQNAGAARSRTVAAATKAFQHRDRMPEVESYLARGSFYGLVDYDLTKRIAATRSALALDPDNAIAMVNLGWALRPLRAWVAVESIAVRGMRLRNIWQDVQLAIMAEVAQGHLGDAQANMERYARGSPTSPRILVWRALLAAGRGDYAAAEQEFDRLGREQQGSPAWKAWRGAALPALDEVQGKLARAEQDTRDYMAQNEQRALPGLYVTGAVSLAWLDLRYRNRPSDGLRKVDAALKRHPLATIPALDRPYTTLAALYARAGRPDEAKRLLADFEADLTEGLKRGDFDRYRARGEVALAEGRTRDAIAAYRALHDDSVCVTCGLFEIATAYDRGGQADSALAAYEQVVSTPGLFRLYDDSYTLAPAYKRLGELYEARADRAQAREYYGRFADLWKDADREVQPLVREVRARLARLAGEH
jgi:tetratricopeptide (TPR) repeat protein